MAQMPALIPKEVEIQRLKKIYIMVIMLGSIAASVEVDNFVVLATQPRIMPEKFTGTPAFNCRMAATLYGTITILD